MRTHFARSWSVKAYLVALAVCCTLPIALVAGFFALHLVQNAVDRDRADFSARLYLLREAVDRRIETTVSVLQALATMPALRGGDLSDFRQSAVETVRSLGLFVIVLSDGSGRQLVNTRVNSGDPLPPRAHPEAQQRVLETGRPQVSDLYPATIARRPVISIEVPVTIDGQIRYVLATGIEPQYLSALLQDQLPDGLIASISDRNGILIARQPVPSRGDVIGTSVIPDIRSQIGEPAAFWFEATSREGWPTYISFLRSRTSDWTVSLSIPRSRVQGPFRLAVFVVSAITVTGLIAGLVMARFVAGRLASKAALLEAAASRIATERPVEAVPTMVREYDSALGAFAVASEEIRLRAEERDSAVSALRQSETRWRSIAETLPNLVWTDLPDGQCDWLSSQWCKYTGIPERDLLGTEWLDRVVHPDDRERTLACWQAACADRGEYDLEYRIRRHDGQYRWFKTRGVPLRDDTGKIVYWFGTCTDIEDIRSAERREQVLMQEVNHRAKNMLALVQAIARQTAFRSPEQFISHFEARLRALAASQDLLVKSGWKNVPLDVLVRIQLAHFADALDDRIILSGPSLEIKAAAAQSLGVVLHELSTNAAKYGALSVPGGRVTVDWDIRHPAGAEPEFVIRWAEHEVPAVEEPTRRGFGSKVLEGFARLSLAAETSLRFAPGGLVWELRCRLSAVVDPSGVPVASAEATDAAVFRDPTRDRARVLVVEDEALPAMEVASLLDAAGFDVLGPAASVRAAMRCLEEGSGCDVAVLDVNLGPETSERVARKLFDAGIPFIAVSGYSREQLPALFAGGRLMSKPLDHAALIGELKRITENVGGAALAAPVSA